MLIDFLITNRISAAVIAALVIFSAFLAISVQLERIRLLAFKLMLLAERTFRDQDGPIKYDFVTRIVFKNIPVWMKIFISGDGVKNLVQKWYDAAKDFLDDGKVYKPAKGVSKNRPWR